MQTKTISLKVPFFLTWKYWGYDAPVMLIGVPMVALFFLFSAFLSPAHAQSYYSGNVYRAQGAQTMQDVYPGVVLQKREVAIEPRRDTAMASTGIGAAVGGAAGALIGRKSSARTALMVAGSVLGGLAGNRIGAEAGQNVAIEYLVQVDDGRGRPRIVAVVQPNPGPDLEVGDSVFVLNERGANRLIRAVQPQQHQPEAYDQNQSQQMRWGGSNLAFNRYR